MNPINLCVLALQLWVGNGVVLPDAEDKLNTCVETVEESQRQNVDTYTIVAMAWVESGFKKDAVSSEGAIGALQIIPKYWCPDGDKNQCDLVASGVTAYATLLRKYDKKELALCHYNSGNRCTPRSRDYASRVLRLARSLKRGVAKQSETGECDYSCGC